MDYFCFHAIKQNGFAFYDTFLKRKNNHCENERLFDKPGPINVRWISTCGKYVLWPKDKMILKLFNWVTFKENYFTREKFINHFNEKMDGKAFYETLVHSWAADGCVG